MIIEKNIINAIRNTIKKANDLNSRSLNNLKRALDYARNMPSIIGREAAIQRLNEVLNEDIPLSYSKQQVILYFKRQVDYIELKLLKIKTILAALSKEGMSKVTYELPFLIISAAGEKPNFSYLAITGIKINGENPKEEFLLLDEIEKQYIELEKEMAKLINPDYSVDIEKVSAFLDLFLKYMILFINQLELYGQTFKEKTFILSYRLMCMISYFIYCKKGIILDKETQEKVGKALSTNIASGTHIDFDEILQEHCKNYLDMKDIVKTCIIEESVIVKDNSSMPKDENPIAKYLVNGVVAVPCEEEHFKELLNDAPYTSIQKDELLAQLRNLQKRLEKEVFESAIKEVKSSLLTRDEIDLIERLRTDLDAKPIIENIEDLIELSLSEKDAESLEFIKEELSEQIGILNEILTLRNSLKVESKDSIGNIDANVVFYKTEIKTEDGKKLKPKFLISLLGFPLSAYKKIYIPLEKLFKSQTKGDLPLQGDDFPCRVYFKGYEYKIFYSIIKDTIVIIDLGKGGTHFKNVQNIVTSKEFRSFISQLQTGEAIDSSEDNEEVLNVINRGIVAKKHNSKKMKFTPKA